MGIPIQKKGFLTQKYVGIKTHVALKNVWHTATV